MRSWLVITAISALILFALVDIVTQKSPRTREAMIAFILFLVIVPLLLLYIEYERSHSNVRMSAMLGLLVAVSVASRQVMHGFGPSPIFFFSLVSGAVFGPVPGFVHGSMTIFVSNFFVGGHGPWTILQMTALGLVGMVAGLLPKRRRMLTLSVWGFVAGFAFGLLTDLSTWLFFTPEHTLSTYVGVAARGLPFDLSYGIGTVVFIKVMGRPMLNVLTRFKKRMSLDYIV